MNGPAFFPRWLLILQAWCCAIAAVYCLAVGEGFLAAKNEPPNGMGILFCAVSSALFTCAWLVKRQQHG